MPHTIEIFNDGEGWRVRLDGRLLPTTWNSRGAALAGAQVEINRMGALH